MEKKKEKKKPNSVYNSYFLWTPLGAQFEER
jgi:hypothetical protein